MNSQSRNIYSTFDKRWMQVVSKDDVIQILVDNEWRKGIALQLKLDSVRLKLDGSDSVVDVNCKIVKILEKKIKQNQIVPVEVNDLVTLVFENDAVSAIVTQVQSFVQLTITSPKNYCKQIIVPAKQLRFVAKGYSLSDFQPYQPVNDLQSVPGSSYRGPSTSGIMDPKLIHPVAMNSSVPSQNNQMNSAMALLYPAPCIIMAIPPLNDPADFPEAMAVQLPWRENESPTILPVIRMGPGTMVVVVPATSNSGIIASQGPIQVSVQSVINT